MKKSWSNQELAELLKSVSAALEVKGKSRFRVTAYDQAADSLESLSASAKTLWEKGELKNISGIGEKISGYLSEVFQKGKSDHFEKIQKAVPLAMFELIKVNGIGPKTAYKLCQELGIKARKNALRRTLKAAKKGKIRQIMGFGKKSEADIKAGISDYLRQEKKEKRMLLSEALEISEKIIRFLQKDKKVIRADVLGSIRRGSATVGDIDLSIATNDPQAVIKKLEIYPKLSKVLEAGRKKISFLLSSGHQIDAYVQDPKAYGSLLQHFTGSKHHNIRLREIALEKGFSLSEHGMKDTRKRKKYSFEKEKDFYQFLGMDYIPPELRENQGEIEQAQKGSLPKLAELKDIKGDLQLHSSFPIEPSHDLGKSSFAQMLKKGKELGYHYLGFTEHNPSLSQHNKNQIIVLLKSKEKKIEELRKTIGRKLKIEIINGLEVDIRPDGQLALPESGFLYLDYVIASIHSVFNQDKKTMTKRIVRGLSHPKVKILGHPTTRMLNKRSEIEADWEEIYAFCLKENKILEINASPNRLDLPDILVRQAISRGLKLIINADSHHVTQMDFMKYGVIVAKRGWAKKSDIVNCYPFADLCEIMKIEKGVIDK